jgi:cysteine desulfurase
MCFTHVNNETGAILPIKDIVALRNSYNKKIAIYLDCVQSVGKLDINLTTLGVEMASFSGHKIHAVKGVGVLYIKTGIIVEPFILGGGQQGGMRSGTESLFLANAFATALEETISHKVESASNVSEINEYLRKELLARKALIVSPEDASPYVLNVSFDGFESETMLHCLEKYEIYVSTISACSARTKRISYVLLAMGLDRKIASNSVRLSFSRYNTMDAAKEFISKVDEIYSLYSLKR